MLILFKRMVDISLNQYLSITEMEYASEAQGCKMSSDNLFLIIDKIPNSTIDLLFKNMYVNVSS